MVVDVTRAQFPTFNETTIPTMSGVINSLTGGKHTGERKRSLERISTCLLIVTFWGDRSFPSWKLRFLLITPYCFALHRGKLLLGGYFFPFFPFFQNYFAIIRVPFDSYDSRNMNANFQKFVCCIFPPLPCVEFYLLLYF